MPDATVLWDAPLSDDEIIQQSVGGALPRTAASLEVSDKSWVADSHSTKGAGRDPALLKIDLNLLN